MKNLTFIISAIVFFMTACSYSLNTFANGIKGNKNITSKEVKISDYSFLQSSGSADVIYEQKNTAPYLRIEIDENLQEYVKIESDGNKLSISTKENIRPTSYKIYTNSRNIQEIKNSGSGDIQLKGKIETDNLTISMSGSGDMKGKQIYCRKLEISVSGSADVSIAGKCESSQVRISGSGDLKAFDMIVKNMSCSVSGSGDAEIYASESLTVRVSGSGDVKYKGNPKDKNITKSGSGSVKER